MVFHANGTIKLKCGDCGTVIAFTERNKLTEVIVQTLPVWCVECHREKVQNDLARQKEQSA